MRRRNEQSHEHENQWGSYEPPEWPASTVELDDEAFARAIADGRKVDVAA